MQTPLLLTGIGLRPPHYEEFISQRPKVAWVEVHSENYFGEGGKALQTLEAVRRDYPVSLHGVGLSIGSSDELNWHHLRQLRDLSLRIKPCLISDHLSWSSLDGQYFHDFLPLPYTEEALAFFVSRVEQIQAFLKQQILIENISSYIAFKHSVIPEAEFLAAVAKQSGCGILLDVNNLYVSAHNLGFDANHYLSIIPAESVQEIHLGGFSRLQRDDKDILIDSHNQTIMPGVWDLYRNTLAKIGRKPTIIEWDTDLPSLETLYLEAYRAEKILREMYVANKLTG